MLKMRKSKPAPTVVYEPYKNCPFCKHREKPGCFGCKERKTSDEREAAQKAADLARMEASRLGTFRLDNPAEMETLKSVFSAEKLGELFSAQGISDEEVLANLGDGSVEAGEEKIKHAFGIAQQLYGWPAQMGGFESSSRSKPKRSITIGRK